MEIENVQRPATASRERELAPESFSRRAQPASLARVGLVSVGSSGLNSFGYQPYSFSDARSGSGRVTHQLTQAVRLAIE